MNVLPFREHVDSGIDGVRMSRQNRIPVQDRLLHIEGLLENDPGSQKLGPSGRAGTGTVVTGHCSGQPYWSGSGFQQPCFGTARHRRPPRLAEKDNGQANRYPAPRLFLAAMDINGAFFPSDWRDCSEACHLSLPAPKASFPSSGAAAHPSRWSRLSRPQRSRFHDPAPSAIYSS